LIMSRKRYGYAGQILMVDLTRGKSTVKPLNRELASNYIGGYGIGGRILYDEVPPWVSSLDPANKLIFATGPATGGTTPVAGRHTVITKSPLTGFFGNANSGGFWGAELKMAGYDAIVVTGRSPKPVFLFVKDGKCEILNADAYWGKDAREADRSIRKDLNENEAKAATIGIAGENLVRFAGIVNDEANRIAARCGVGAVMGFKKLKGIVVRGSERVPVADPEGLKKVSLDIIKHIKTDNFLQTFTKGGTPGLFEMVWQIGDVPAYNWSRGDFGGSGDPGVEKIAYPGGFEKVLSGNRACHVCPIACRRIVTVQGPCAFEENVEGPEYETLAAFGSNCGMDNVEILSKLNDLCNLYGIDAISAGSTIAFAMECFEKGLIDRGDMDGLDLQFGNGEAMITILEKIARRDGFGNILAEGTRRASKIIGQGSEAYAMHVKGMEIAMHDPRACQGSGVLYATASTGGSHTEGLLIETSNERFSTVGKAAQAKKVADWTAFYNASGFCHFGPEMNAYSADNIINAFNAITGLSIDYNEALKAGERIFNLKRAFNIRHGLTRKDDTIPERLLKETTKSGVVNNLNAMLPEYYRLRGWDEYTAKPTPEKLSDLKLDDVSVDLWGKS